jgi:hypothetical protein
MLNHYKSLKEEVFTFIVTSLLLLFGVNGLQTLSLACPQFIFNIYDLT